MDEMKENGCDKVYCISWRDHPFLEQTSFSKKRDMERSLPSQ